MTTLPSGQVLPTAADLPTELSPAAKLETARAMLVLVLGCVDYTQGACAPNELVSAVLPSDLIESAHRALRLTR